MAEKRSRPRRLTLRTGKIVAGALPAPVDCVVLNYSEAGAALMVPPGCEVPQSFRLVLDPDQTTLACRTQWQAGSRVGVAFSGFADAAASGREGEGATADDAGEPSEAVATGSGAQETESC
jgi:hypothetical protein